MTAKKSPGQPVATTPGSAPAAAAWSVRIGSQGGFTGGGSGQVIRSDGSVESWSQITPDEKSTQEPAGHADAPALDALFRAMNSPEMRALQYHEAGNMTTFLEWQQGTEVRSWSWAESARGARIPEPLQHAYEAALAVVNSAQR
jgi:hypothetical protein